MQNTQQIKLRIERIQKRIERLEKRLYKINPAKQTELFKRHSNEKGNLIIEMRRLLNQLENEGNQ